MIPPALEGLGHQTTHHLAENLVAMVVQMTGRNLLLFFIGKRMINHSSLENGSYSPELSTPIFWLWVVLYRKWHGFFWGILFPEKSTERTQRWATVTGPGIRKDVYGWGNPCAGFKQFHVR